jgi:hypothetical protein
VARPVRFGRNLRSPRSDAQLTTGRQTEPLERRCGLTERQPPAFGFPAEGRPGEQATWMTIDEAAEHLSLSARRSTRWPAGRDLLLEGRWALALSPPGGRRVDMRQGRLPQVAATRRESRRPMGFKNLGGKD